MCMGRTLTHSSLPSGERWGNGVEEGACMVGASMHAQRSFGLRACLPALELRAVATLTSVSAATAGVNAMIAPASHRASTLSLPVWR